MAPSRHILIVALCLAFGLGIAPVTSRGQAPSSTGFNCQRATSKVNRLICGKASLGALDRKLNDDYAATLHQGGIDAKALMSGEAVWLRDIRNRCEDAACLRQAYEARDNAILAMSLKAASPAAYAETRPFPAPAAEIARLRAYVGRPCGSARSNSAAFFAGFTIPSGFRTLTFSDGVILPLERGGLRFAILLRAADDPKACRIADVVSLPAASLANVWLQCSLEISSSHGLGIRRAGQAPVVAYWAVNADTGKLDRAPLGVLGGADQVRCNFPETGE